jgi:hypothetical protein
LVGLSFDLNLRSKGGMLDITIWGKEITGGVFTESPAPVVQCIPTLTGMFTTLEKTKEPNETNVLRATSFIEFFL